MDVGANKERTEKTIGGAARIRFSDLAYHLFALPMSWLRLLLTSILAAIILVSIVAAYKDVSIFEDASRLMDFYAQIWKPVLIILPLWIVAVRIICSMILFFKLRPSQKQMNYEIGDENLRLWDDCGNRIVLPWQEVKHFRERRAGYVVQVRPYGSRWIPKRAFDEADRATLVHIARDNGVLRGTASA